MLRWGAGRTIPLVIRPANRRALAEKAVAKRGVSIALACRAFEVSETCYRYSPKLDDENVKWPRLCENADRGNAGTRADDIR